MRLTWRSRIGRIRRSLCAILLSCGAIAAGADGRPRLVVLTDIGGDPDDRQSLVRLLAYSNEFSIEGLIASASGTPGELKEAVVRPDLVRETILAYGEVRGNLARHAGGFPSTRSLLDAVRAGSPHRGVANLGEGRDTAGSRWIVGVVDRPDPRPVNIAVWGGAHDLAQALWRVRHDRSPAEARRFVAKLRVHSIDHQDDTGPWILENFRDLFFILSSANPEAYLGRPGSADKRLAVYRGMYLGGNEALTSREWIDRNVRTGHGPLGALYPPKTWTAPNPHGALKEGDTPSWFYFLPNGLSDPGHPEWGCWGGRFRRLPAGCYGDVSDQVGELRDARATVWRWREAYQNDFEARMDWCAGGDRSRANHNPVAVVNADRSRDVLRVSARARETLSFTARGSSDPDGDALALRWFHYPEPGGSARAIDLGSASAGSISFTVPGTAPPGELHIVLEVKDNGRPPLFAYRRVVIGIAPAGGAPNLGR